MRRCSGIYAKRIVGVMALVAMTGLGSALASAEEQWVYGNHPILGLSAHVDLGDGNAIGFACNQPKFNPISDSFVAIRVTDGLTSNGTLRASIDPEGYTLNFDASWGRQQNGYMQFVGNTCDTNIIPVQTGSGIQSTSPSWAVGLKGSSKALSQLIAACPSMRQDIAENCGI